MQDFIDDLHYEISIKDIIIEMGIASKKDFRGQFINCLFHDEDAPSSEGMPFEQHIYSPLK